MIVVVVVVERVRRKCPPASGIKMIIGGSRPATVTTNHQMQQSTGTQWG